MSIRTILQNVNGKKFHLTENINAHYLVTCKMSRTKTEDVYSSSMQHFCSNQNAASNAHYNNHTKTVVSSQGKFKVIAICINTVHTKK